MALSDEDYATVEAAIDEMIEMARSSPFPEVRERARASGLALLDGLEKRLRDDIDEWLDAKNGMKRRLEAATQTEPGPDPQPA